MRKDEMKPSDFEQRMKDQPVRQVPPEWRASILSAARTAARQDESETGKEIIAGWRLLFNRMPVAWSALAAMWLMIVGANAILSEPAGTRVAASKVNAPVEVGAMGYWQRTDVRLLVQMLDDIPGEQYQKPQPADRPRPRSQGKSDQDFGSLPRYGHFQNAVV